MLTRIFARSKAAVAARRREAVARRWDATADRLAGKRAKAQLEAQQAFENRLPGIVQNGLAELIAQYAKAERAARTLAEQVRTGR